jgi:hypothetical protein
MFLGFYTFSFNLHIVIVHMEMNSVIFLFICLMCNNQIRVTGISVTSDSDHFVVVGIL